MPKVITLLLLAAIETLAVGLGTAQNASHNLKTDDRWVLREITSPITHSDQVCFSTCKYTGSSSSYIGMSASDDQNCTAACGKALQECNKKKDGPCQYVSGSCKYTNCN